MWIGFLVLCATQRLNIGAHPRKPICRKKQALKKNPVISNTLYKLFGPVTQAKWTVLVSHSKENYNE